MRFKSIRVDGIQVFAVAGVNTVSFGLSVSAEARAGLLGFAVERVDPTQNERYFVRGFKVFPSVVPAPDEHTLVSTFEHPIQSLVWDDFTAAPGHTYAYVFHPLRGTPKNLDRSATPVSIGVTTEPLYGQTHGVFFNRGVASSQAYARTFMNLPPDQQPTVAKRQKALNWLSRDLDDAMLRFIRSAKKGDALRCCFYEFTYPPVIDELLAAIGRQVDVRLVVDCKVNEHTSNEKQPDGRVKQVFYPSDPRLRNLDAIRSAKLPDAVVIRRESRRSDIAHNKFMVRLKGPQRTPVEVWTGSTNLTTGGVHGQANVGHWVRDPATAQRFFEYWTLLSTDPGGAATDTRSAVIAKNRKFLDAVAVLSPPPATVAAIPKGITPVFSPRTGLAPLDLYSTLIDGAQSLACATFAFGIAKQFKDLLKNNTSKGPLCFFLLESEDRPDKRAKDPFVRLNAANNVYEAFGSEIDTPLGQWVVETTTKSLQLNTHVAFIHCKFLLRDPLGADPIVVTGSANFSEASTKANDENMVIIRGDQRAADIYFSEFNRLFNHYYFRSVVERTKRDAERGVTPGTNPDLATLFLLEDDSWLEKYKRGSLRSKRATQFVKMAGAQETLP